jgi:hypothetical protein
MVHGHLTEGGGLERTELQDVISASRIAWSRHISFSGCTTHALSFFHGRVNRRSTMTAEGA